jgi:uncharacterized membrane protein (UPF0127 family)
VTARPHFLAPLMGPGDAACVLRNERTGEVVASRLEIAADSKARRRGLLGRSGLAAGTALIIAPCNGVHTFFMQFTIDVVFASRDGRVLKICRNLAPWRMGAALSAFAALEFASGTVERAGIAVGDRLTVRLESEPQHGAGPASATRQD